jgi:multidrug transporter EmrE-like cation transporter
MAESLFSTAIPLRDWAAIITSVTLNAAAQIFLRLGVRDVRFVDVLGSGDPRAIAGMFLAPQVIGGLLCYVVSVVLWMYVLSQQPVGVVYPMVSLAYLAAVLMGVLFLGEAFSPQRMLGLAFIMVGVWFIARSA